MATKQKDGPSQPSRSRKAPKKSASKPTSRSATKKEAGAPKRAQPKAMTGSQSATKSQAVPAKVPVLRRITHRGTFDLWCVKVAVHIAGPLRIPLAQGSLLNPMAWLSTLETTLTSPQARTVMAEALRAVANVLEKPQSGEQGQGGGTREGRDAVSAAASLGAEIVAAPLEVAAAAIGAAGEVVTSALGGSRARTAAMVTAARAQTVLLAQEGIGGRTSRRSARSDGKPILQPSPVRPSHKRISVH